MHDHQTLPPLETPAEIAALLRAQIEAHRGQIEPRQTGTVVQVGDGIARVYGLQDCMAQELLAFDSGGTGLALTLETDAVCVAILTPGAPIRQGTAVRRTGEVLQVPVGEGLLGRVVDALGAPIDGRGPVTADGTRPVETPAPGLLARRRIDQPLPTGLKAVDSLTPIGRGQRELIIGDRQTGKTTVAVDTILQQRHTGVRCVYVAIGQKSSAVVQLVEELTRAGAMDYTLVVSAPASAPAPLQYLAPYAGCAMAESFRDRGQDALIVYDDLSRHAVAWRAMSLLIRRPPGREAYPGDVFYLHARLLERAARLAEGSLTALPIVETQGGDVSAYIPTNVISITDGQIVLDGELFHAGVRPAVHPGLSVSRVGGAAQLKAMRQVAGALKRRYAQARELQAFAQLGSDLDADTRAQLAFGERIVAVLRQDSGAPVRPGCQVALLHALLQGLLDALPVAQIPAFEQALFHRLATREAALLARIEADQWSPEDEAQLRQVLTDTLAQVVSDGH